MSVSDTIVADSTSILISWEQLCSNLLNVNLSTSHEGSEVYTAEPDIPEPSLVEVELAVEKLKKHKATRVYYIPSALIQTGGSKLYSFGTKKNCHKNGKNPLLFLFIRKAIEWTVIIIEEFLSCLLHIKFFRTYFYRE